MKLWCFFTSSGLNESLCAKRKLLPQVAEARTSRKQVTVETKDEWNEAHYNLYDEFFMLSVNCLPIQAAG